MRQGRQPGLNSNWGTTNPGGLLCRGGVTGQVAASEHAAASLPRDAR